MCPCTIASEKGATLSTVDHISTHACLSTIHPDGVAVRNVPLTFRHARVDADLSPVLDPSFRERQFVRHVYRRNATSVVREAKSVTVVHGDRRARDGEVAEVHDVTISDLPRVSPIHVDEVASNAARGILGDLSGKRDRRVSKSDAMASWKVLIEQLAADMHVLVGPKIPAVHDCLVRRSAKEGECGYASVELMHVFSQSLAPHRICF